MELLKIKLTKLFGVFTHEIPLKTNGITLVLGENGLGKTVILKMLRIVFTGNYLQLKKYEFERFDLDFDDFKYSFFGSIRPEEERLIARCYKGNKKIEELDFLDADLSENFISKRMFRHNDMLFENDFIGTSGYSEELEHIAERYLSGRAALISPGEWIDHRTGKVLKTRTVISKYGKSIPPRYRKFFQSSFIPAWLEGLSKRVNTYLIETQRLRARKRSDSYQDAVTEISKEIAQEVKEVLASANEHASQLDRSYPTRLLSKIDELQNISDEDIEHELETLEKRRKKLKKIGLVDPFEDEFPQPMGSKKERSAKQSELIKNVLLVYVEDSNSKLDKYNKLADKLEVFFGIVNERLKAKKVQIDREKGLTAILDKTARDIPLTGLSSGEQHMIILFYNLLFKCENNSLILIDEPEISLHIDWQNNFINDLHRIQSITPFEALIATHSPDIINENWDLTVELRED